MSAMLRAYGTEFDVDVYLVDCSLPVCAVKHRGEPRHPRTKPEGQSHDRSGIHFMVSKADFDFFAQQIEEAIAFLQENDEEVRRLCKYPGVEEVEIDFGIARRDVAAQSDCLPAELLRHAGELGLDIVISHYSISPSSPG